MRLVVDSNIIFSALIKDSLSRKLLTHLDAELYTINFSNQEIDKYKSEILKKAELNEAELELLLSKLKDRLINIEDGIVALKMEQADEIMKKIDPTDSPFLAAALAINADIWSDDKHFKKQDNIKVWKTQDLVRFL